MNKTFDLLLILSIKNAKIENQWINLRELNCNFETNYYFVILVFAAISKSDNEKLEISDRKAS